MGKTIEITKENAQKAFKDADAVGKKMLQNLLGKTIVCENVMDLVKSFEDACEVTANEPHDVLPYQNPQNGHQKALNAYAKMFVIAKALNGDWVADWKDSSQWKYYPWFDMSSGSGLAPTTAMARTRIRLSALDFALHPVNWLSMLANNSQLFMQICSL